MGVTRDIRGPTTTMDMPDPIQGRTMGTTGHMAMYSSVAGTMGDTIFTGIRLAMEGPTAAAEAITGEAVASVAGGAEGAGKHLMRY